MNKFDWIRVVSMAMLPGVIGHGAYDMGATTHRRDSGVVARLE